MKRRDFIGGVAVLAASHYTFPAPPKKFRLGVLSPSRDHWDGGGEITRELRVHGLAEGDNLTIIVRYPRGDTAKFLPLARDLAALKVDAILTGTTLGTRAAMEATKTIPIVTYLGDAERSGIAARYAAAGRNVTGLSQGAGEEFSKRLDLMRKLVPKMRELVVFLHPLVVVALSELYEPIARDLGMPIRIIIASDAGEVLKSLDGMPRGASHAGFVIDRLESPEVAGRAIAMRMALGGHTDRWVEGGGLLMYALNHRNGAQRLAALVAAVLRGADPGRLPFELPDTEDFVINRATARAVGVQLPNDILVRARFLNE